MHIHAFEALGTHFEIRIDKSEVQAQELCKIAQRIVHDFESLYSRFKHDSLLMQISRTVGVHTVPPELIEMLRMYERLEIATEGAVSPLVGSVLEGLGYDAGYSFKNSQSRSVNTSLATALGILSNTTLQVYEPVSLDLGAVGKGCVVDILYTFLRSKTSSDFLINASGDMRHHAKERALVVGLEHPFEEGLILGSVSIHNEALCASSVVKRSWEGVHHYVDARTGKNEESVLATWVIAHETVVADALTTALFFVPAQRLRDCGFEFEYVKVYRDMSVEFSKRFESVLFV
jgi:FAD:protein FMN transferase